MKTRNLIGKEVCSEYDNGFKLVYLITDFETNKYTKGFKIAFRTYELTKGIGGFETTLWVSNCDPELAEAFCGETHEYRFVEKMLKAKITVSVAYRCGF